MHSHIFADEFPVYVNVCLNCYELLSELHVLKELTQHIIHDGTLCYFGEEKKNTYKPSICFNGFVSKCIMQ